MARDTDHDYKPTRDTDHGMRAIDDNTATKLSLRPSAPNPAAAYLVHIYPTGPEMASRYVLGPAPLQIGRGSDCDIALNDQAASRRHAVVELRADGYYVFDMDSTNGTFINNVRVAQARLNDGDNLRVGNHIFRFLLGTNVEVSYHEEIYRLTIVDALTEIYNKRYLMECLTRELTRSARYHRPLALVLFDVDHFKRINDDLGHLGGDEILRQLAGCVKAAVRKDGLFARYGGEEFAVVLPETGLEGAVCFAERIRERVASHPFAYEGKAQAVTISLGVAAVPGGEAVTAEEFIRRADERLYQAKREGRNRVAAEPPPAALPPARASAP